MPYPTVSRLAFENAVDEGIAAAHAFDDRGEDRLRRTVRHTLVGFGHGEPAPPPIRREWTDPHGFQRVYTHRPQGRGHAGPLVWTGMVGRATGTPTNYGLNRTGGDVAAFERFQEAFVAALLPVMDTALASDAELAKGVVRVRRP